jgi:selenocysteine lyase/cysteine desulfurase
VSFDLERARAETPGVDHRIHLNSAGASLMPQPVIDAVMAHFTRESEIGGYEAAAEAHDRIEAVYDSIASLIGAHRHEIACVENATRAWDMAFYSVRLAEGDRILTSMAEYASNVIPFLQVADRHGVRVEVVPNDESGALDVEALTTMLDDRVRLIAITHVPTNGGLVNPAPAIGRVANDAGVPFLLDGCQSVGQLAIDVDEIGCDMLSGTSRKYLRGPRGQGFLYVRQEWIEKLDPPFLDLRAAQWTAPDSYRIRQDARRFETWETDIAARLGMGAAVDYVREWGIGAIETRVKALADSLRRRLDAISGVEVTDLGAEQCGIVTFSCADPAGVKQALAERGINVEVSTAASTRFDMTARGLAAVVRASVHYFNSEDELDRFAVAVSELVAS